MPRTRSKPPAADAPRPLPPSSTSHLFGGRKPERGAKLTHEDISADLRAFRKAGGKIEVLGNTQALRRIGAPADATPPAVAATPPKRRR